MSPVRALPDRERPLAGSREPWTQHIARVLDETMHHVSQIRPPGTTLDERVNRTYGTLDMLGAQLGVLPGRKAIVWISHGLPLQLESSTGLVDYSPLLHKLSAALDRVPVAVYPVFVESDPVRYSTTRLISTETLRSIAELTGGRSYLNHDIRTAIYQTAIDAHADYVIGFYSMPALDCRYVKLRVTCARKGIRVLAKQGFYGCP